MNENQSLRGLRGRQSRVHVAHVRSTNTWGWGVHSGSFGDFPAEGGLDFLLARRVRVDLRQLTVGKGHVGSQRRHVDLKKKSSSCFPFHDIYGQFHQDFMSSICPSRF